MIKTNVLDKGCIELIDKMGSDERIIETARISHKSEGTHESDVKLIKLLVDKGHKTPFEHCVFTFKVKAPLFVARQWMRHRIGSFNEVSARYTTVQDFYVPNEERFMNCPKSAQKIMQGHMMMLFATYNELVTNGVAKEVARMILPTAMYTEFYWTVNLSSLINFLNLRLDSHAQWEIRQYAEVLKGIVKETNPIVYSALYGEERDIEVLNEFVHREYKGSDELWDGCNPNCKGCVNLEDNSGVSCDDCDGNNFEPIVKHTEIIKPGDVLKDNKTGNGYAKVIMPNGEDFDGTSCIEIPPQDVVKMANYEPILDTYNKTMDCCNECAGKQPNFVIGNGRCSKHGNYSVCRNDQTMCPECAKELGVCKICGKSFNDKIKNVTDKCTTDGNGSVLIEDKQL